MRFVVDSSVWIDFLNNTSNEKTAFLDKNLSSSIILLGDIVKLEILQGIKDDDQFKKVKSTLAEFILVQMMLPSYAVEYAEMYRTLRKNGITIRKTIDTIIAGYCILHNLPLLQRDRDFKPFETEFGLTLL
jgi:predicted nucleic acid-binding protein